MKTATLITLATSSRVADKLRITPSTARFSRSSLDAISRGFSSGNPKACAAERKRLRMREPTPSVLCSPTNSGSLERDRALTTGRRMLSEEMT